METLAGPGAQLQPGPRLPTHVLAHIWPEAARGTFQWQAEVLAAGARLAETNLKAGFLGKPPGQALRACGDLHGCQASEQPGAMQETAERF